MVITQATYEGIRWESLIVMNYSVLHDIELPNLNRFTSNSTPTFGYRIINRIQPKDWVITKLQFEVGGVFRLIIKKADLLQANIKHSLLDSGNLLRINSYNTYPTSNTNLINS